MAVLYRFYCYFYTVLYRYTSRVSLISLQNNVNSMEVAINGVSTTMDSLSERMLENNVDVARRNLQIQKVRQEVGKGNSPIYAEFFSSWVILRAFAGSFKIKLKLKVPKISRLHHKVLKL